MMERLFIAGSGGQGVIFSAKLIATTVMQEGHNVTMIPTYGAEMRGGTSLASVVVSDDEIVMPFVEHPDTLVCYNKPAFEAYEQNLKPGGLFVLNSSQIKEEAHRRDVTVVQVEADSLAHDAGSIRAVNMVMVGVLSKVLDLFSFDDAVAGMKQIISADYSKLLEVNLAALKLGYEAV